MYAAPDSQFNKRRGFNLIEAAIVLGVVGLVIGGIWTAAAAVSRQHKVTQTVSGMRFIANRLNAVFGKTSLSTDSSAICDTHCYINLSAQQIQDMGALPDGWSALPSGQLESPIFPYMSVSIFSPETDPNVEAYYTIIIQGSLDAGTYLNQQTTCKLLGAEALKTLGKKETIQVTLSGAGSDYVSGSTAPLTSAHLNDGTSISNQSILPDPLWATRIDDCWSLLMAFPRP